MNKVSNKVSAGKCEMSVNDVHLNWDEDAKRRAIACLGCTKPTKGRANFDSRAAHVADAPYCIGCAMTRAFALGFAPIKKAMKQLRGGNVAR